MKDDIRDPSFDSAAVTLSMSRVPPCNLINSYISQPPSILPNTTYLDKSKTDTSPLMRPRNRSYTMEPFSDQVNISCYPSVTSSQSDKRKRTRDSNTTILDRQDPFIWPIRYLNMYESRISKIRKLVHTLAWCT